MNFYKIEIISAVNNRVGYGNSYLFIEVFQYCGMLFLFIAPVLEEVSPTIKPYSAHISCQRGDQQVKLELSNYQPTHNNNIIITKRHFGGVVLYTLIFCYSIPYPVQHQIKTI